MPQRIHKILSAHGVASRRAAERLILAGRVTVDGISATLGQSARSGIDIIAVDGVPLGQRPEHFYIMLNKPRGYVTTASDERGRKTVMDLVDGVGARVYPVGRLDMNSEGLLLMTNDGKFANSITHPSYSITKTYEAHVRGDALGAVAAMRGPMTIDSHIVHAVSVGLKKKTDAGGVLSITVNEGRKRQIRKMCDQCSLDVRLLIRVAIGPVTLGSLRTGKWRHLTEGERQALVNGCMT